MDAWASRVGVTLRVVAEFSDTALAKTACAEGAGVMAVPSLILSQAAHRYGLVEVGACEGVSQSIYAIVAPRRLTHPGVMVLLGSS